MNGGVQLAAPPWKLVWNLFGVCPQMPNGMISVPHAGRSAGVIAVNIGSKESDDRR